MLQGHDDNVKSVYISDNGKQVVYGSDYKAVRVWDCDLEKGFRTVAVVQGNDGFLKIVSMIKDRK